MIEFTMPPRKGYPRVIDRLETKDWYLELWSHPDDPSDPLGMVVIQYPGDNQVHRIGRATWTDHDDPEEVTYAVMLDPLFQLGKVPIIQFGCHTKFSSVSSVLEKVHTQLRASRYDRTTLYRVDWEYDAGGDYFEDQRYFSNRKEAHEHWSMLRANETDYGDVYTEKVQFYVAFVPKPKNARSLAKTLNDEAWDISYQLDPDQGFAQVELSFACRRWGEMDLKSLRADFDRIKKGGE